MILYIILMRKKATIETASETAEMATKKKPVRRTTRKKTTPAAVNEEAPATVETNKEKVTETSQDEPQVETTRQNTQSDILGTEEPKESDTPSIPQTAVIEKKQAQEESLAYIAPPASPAFKRKKTAIDVSSIHDFCDLASQGARIPLLSDQQIQQLTYEDAFERNILLEKILRQVLDYDIVLSDTNIWLELLVGHTSCHSDPRVNARLQFERQLEFISKLMKRIGGKFMIMSETYEEIDRFATVLDPVSYKDVDWNDETICRNVSARLAKKLMLAQQKENRLRIEGIGSESHHSAFADPAIIRRTVEFFAEGKKVLLLTNDASVGIRSLGMCDDMQRTNKIDDKTWREVYEPHRPMVLTMDDLKLLDQYTRQYYFLLMPAGRQWMQDVSMRETISLEKPLTLWMEGFRAGDRHERRSDRIEQQRKEQQQKEQKQKEKEAREAQLKAEQEREQQQNITNQDNKESRRKVRHNTEKEILNITSEGTKNQTEDKKKKKSHSDSKKVQNILEQAEEKDVQTKEGQSTVDSKEAPDINNETSSENESKKKSRSTRRGGRRRSNNK